VAQLNGRQPPVSDPGAAGTGTQPDVDEVAVLTFAQAPLPQGARFSVVHAQVRLTGEPELCPAIDIHPGQLMSALNTAAGHQAGAQ
jgi:hypothetical protein